MNLIKKLLKFLKGESYHNFDISTIVVDNEGEIKFPKYTVLNKEKSDYLSKGITCNIIKTQLITIIWNVDEKKIQDPKDLFIPISPSQTDMAGNRFLTIRTYSTLDEKDIELINDNWGIAILESNKSINKSKNKYYKFAILEGSQSEIRNKRIENILKN